VPAPHWFIVPPLDGPISGGTLYNRELLSALRGAGQHAEALDLEAGRAALAGGTLGVFWLDTLYLPAFAELELLSRGRALGLIAHYLPSLLPHGETLMAGNLAPDEALALARATHFLVPSTFMARTLVRLGAARSPLFVVEPGRPAPAVAAALRGPAVRALCVANLVPNKGVEPLLSALARELDGQDPFELELAGALDLDPPYVTACRAWLEHPILRSRVKLLGAVAHERVCALMRRSNLLLSASRMESYGMALAEARSLGIPLLALRGGNAEALVGAVSGGQLVDDEVELARATARLARDAIEHERRLSLAYERRLAPRTWADAARELSAQLEASSLGRA
jgi:glycosyltransferase involved in cell wall biosynthesis